MNPLKRALATALCVALVLLSPGLGAWSAAAATFTSLTHGPGAGAWAPRVQALLTSDLSRFEGVKTGGLELKGLLTSFAHLDLSTEEGRRVARPILERLDSVPRADTQGLILSAIVRATLDVRASARAALARGTEDLAGLNRTLDLLASYAIYLEPAQREQVAAARAKVKGLLGEQVVAETVSSWGTKRAETTPGSFGKTETLLKPALATKTAVNEVPRPALPRRGAKAALGAAAVAAAAVGIATLGALPLLAIALSMIGSILLHETAHLWMLRRLGEDTASKHGAGSLNPLRLVDPWGTLAVPFLTLGASSLFGLPIVFGWAKPIPVDFNNLRDRQKDPARVAFAGPAANALVAGLAFAAWWLVPGASAAALVLATVAKMNLALAIFNLLPLPNLDGGKVLVRFLPKTWYARWVRNPSLPAGYQSTFRKLYEGPANLLSRLHVHGQGRVNLLTRVVSLAALAGFYALTFHFIGAPVLLMMLVCSYDYYCIREKVQNEAAVKELIGILQGMAAAVGAAAANDDKIASEVDVEEVEHALKNVLEDLVDKLVDSDGFDKLSSDERWALFEKEFRAAAAESLSRKGMAKDSPEAIAAFLAQARFDGHFARLRAWIEAHELWGKWHSPKRKAAGPASSDHAAGAGTLLGLAALALSGLPGLGLGLVAGTLAPQEPPKTFAEALKDPALKLSAKEQGEIAFLLKEMKLENKPPVIGRAGELERVVDAVSSPRGVVNSVVLLGESGVGKTAIVEKLAQALALSDSRPAGDTFKLAKLDGRFLLKLNVTRLLARPDPASALDELLSRLARFNGDSPRTGNRAILFIDEVHRLFRHPGLADALKEPLRDGAVTVIAATTEAEYKQHLEKDEAFRRRLIPIRVPEASEAETLRSLEGAKAWYEELYGVQIPDEALKASAQLSAADQEVFLPGRAFKYLNLAAARAGFDGRRDRLSLAIQDALSDLGYVMERLSDEMSRRERVTEGIKEGDFDTVSLYNDAIGLTQKLVALYRARAAVPESGTPSVGADLVKEAIVRETGVSSGRLAAGSEPMEKYLRMEETLSKRVLGQDEAVRAVAEAVRAYKAGLSDPTKPMGVFYLTGPTGSGKTHLAKELARFLFDDPEALIRLDMSEYMEKHEVSKLFGAPPGYVGYHEGGQLTEKVRRRPHSVILLDEIEKAHPEVWLALLQVFSDGHLTDGSGRRVSFKNTLILMTSNLGMHAVDVESYETEYAALKAEATAAQDDAARAAVEAKKLELARRLAAETKARGEAVTREAFKQTFPPEFAGRLHAPPIVFNRVLPGAAAGIVDLSLQELSRLLAFAGHELAWTPAAAKALAEEGFSISLGARPLENAVRRLVTQPVATELLEQTASGKPTASRIMLDAVGGTLSIAVSPLGPKKLEKSAAEGAASEVFARLFDSALRSAAGQAAPGWSPALVDSWLRAALGLAQEDKDETPAPAVVSPLDSPAPALGAGAAAFSAAHNDAEAKDAGVRAAREALGTALASHPAALRELVLGGGAHPGWLKLFVDLAKARSPQGAAPVRLRFEARAGTLRVVVRRDGPVSRGEAALLARHFRGPVPADDGEARAWAETLNVQGADGRRLYYELYRLLSAVPGARLGYASAEDTEYWLELPGPTAAHAAVAAPSSQNLAQAPLAGSDWTDGVLPTDRHPDAALAKDLADAGFSPKSAAAADAFLRALSDWFKAKDPAKKKPQVHWAVQDGSVRVQVLRPDEPFAPEELAELQALFDAHAGLWPLLAVAGARAFRSGAGSDAAVWVELPKQVPETDQRYHAAARKLNAVALGSLAENVLFLVFEGRHTQEEFDGLMSRHSLAERGLQLVAGDGAGTRAIRLEAWDVDDAAELALALAAEGAVARVDVQPELLAHIRTRTKAAAPASTSSLPAESRAKLEASKLKGSVLRGLRVLFAPGLAFTVVSEVLGRHGIEPNGRELSDGRFEVWAYARDAAEASAKAAALAAESLVVKIRLHPRTLAVVDGAEPVPVPVPAPHPEPLLQEAPELPPGSGSELESLARRFSKAVLDQRGDRSLSVRVEAARTLATVSTTADLEWARATLRLRDLEDEHPLVAAAALVLARHGESAQDAPRVRRALSRLSRLKGHEFKPSKALLIEALAALLVPRGPEEAAALAAHLRAEKAKTPRASGMVPFDAQDLLNTRDDAFVEALYAALARGGGPESRALLQAEARPWRIELYYAYLERVDPDYLRGLAAFWRRDMRRDDSARDLAVLALADFGPGGEEGRGDLTRLFALASARRAAGSDARAAVAAAAALGRMTRRLGAFESVSGEAAAWLRSGQDPQVYFGIALASEAGGEAELAALESLLHAEPSGTALEGVSHEAASAWAALLHRLGLTTRYLTEKAPGAELPRLQAMLAHRNPFVNKAALEALRLHLTKPSLPPTE